MRAHLISALLFLAALSSLVGCASASAMAGGGDGAGPVASLVAEVKDPAPSLVELAINESADTATINGRAYRCTTTDFGGRYDTICNPL